jgi:signal peptidase I
MALLVACMVKFCCFDIMITEGRSMIPTVQPGTVLLINRMAYGFRFPWSSRYLIRWGSPEEGDIVIFPSPLGHLAIKRCTGIVGDSCFFLVGDNKEESYDSRFYGPVPIDAIIGKVIGIK